MVNTSLASLAGSRRDSAQYKIVSSKRKYEVFPGRQKFYCDGRIMMGPDVGVLRGTIALIVIPSTLFFIFDAPYLAKHVSVFLPLITAFCFLLSVSFLLSTAFIDPGVIPRAHKRESDRNQPYGAEDGTARYAYVSRSKTVQINGEEVSLKWCFTCKIYRP